MGLRDIDGRVEGVIWVGSMRQQWGRVEGH